MTLIITVTTSDVVVQAGDRRVTAIEGKHRRIFDPQSNKQVVFSCRDAIGVIGYCGAAFLGQQATDDVIAEALSGETFDPNDRVGYRSREPRDDDDAETWMTRLQGRLDKGLVEERSILAVRNVRLDASGWLARPEGARAPFHFSWANLPAPGEGELTVFGEPPVGERGIAVASEPQLEPSEERLIRSHLEDWSSRPQLADKLRDDLVGVVRQRSRRGIAVGADVMTIVVPDPRGEPRVEITYHPDGDWPIVRMTSPTGEVVVSAPGTVTPWIVTPGLIVAPQMMVGPGPMDIAGLNVEFHAPGLPAGSRTEFVSTSLPRRRRDGAHLGSDDE